MDSFPSKKAFLWCEIKLTRYLVPLFLFLSGVEVSAQAPRVLWSATISSGVWTKAYAIEEAIDGGYVFTGIDHLGIDYLKLRKILDGGILAWERTFASPNYGSVAYGVKRTSDGGFILVGQNRRYDGDRNLHLVKTDSVGVEMWYRIYDDVAGVVGKAVLQLDDRGFIVVCDRDSTRSGTADVYLLRIDSAGSVIWSRSYGGPGNERAAAIQYTPDGGFLIVGETDSFGAGGVDIWLVRTDSDGDTIWTRTYGGDQDDFGTSLVVTSDGGSALSGFTSSFGAGSEDMYLLRVNAIGETLWTRTFGDTASQRGYSVELASDGGVVIAGNTQSSSAYSTSDVFLAKVSADGSDVWTLRFPFTTSSARSAQFQKSIAYAIRRAADSGYVIAGEWSFRNTLSGSFAEAGIAKIDPGTLPIVLPPEPAPPSSFYLEQNHPNPFNPGTTISFSLPHPGFITLKVFNIMGQEVATLLSGSMSAGPHLIRWNPQRFAAGVYFYRLESGELRETKKLILSK